MRCAIWPKLGGRLFVHVPTSETTWEWQNFADTLWDFLRQHQKHLSSISRRREWLKNELKDFERRNSNNGKGVHFEECSVLPPKK